MLIKKDKKSLFSISISKYFFNNKLFSNILKLLGVIQIIFVVSFLYVAITFDKDEIRELVYSSAQKTYWFGKYITNLPKKWFNNISSDTPILNITIAPSNYQLLMTLKDEAIKTGITLQEHKKRVASVINYKKDKFDARIRLKGDGAANHLAGSKWSMRISLNNKNFMGMKSFSLQDPKRRSYMASFMLHKFIENENLLTKRFGLIPVSINGKYMGIYNFEELPDHNMVEFLTNKKNIVVMIDEDDMFRDEQHTPLTSKNYEHLRNVSDFYFNSIIRAHSFNEVLNSKELKKDFERASKLLNNFRTGNLSASEVFDSDKVIKWLAITDLFGAYHGSCFTNIKLVYDRSLDKLYPIVWDAFSENNFSSSVYSNHKMFKLDWIFDFYGGLCPSKTEMPTQMLLDTNVIEKYLTKLDEVTAPDYIDNVMKIIEPKVNKYMNILNLEYPQFKIEDELRRLKGNAKYLRKVYLYPELPFNAYLSSDNNQDNLILVNRKPVPIQINSLVDVTKNQEFKIKNSSSKFILEKNMPGVPGTPKKITFECPNNNCFVDRKIEDLRISAKVVGTKKNTLIKINNWVAYD